MWMKIRSLYSVEYLQFFPEKKIKGIKFVLKTAKQNNKLDNY
jgi:hypothetical protein